MVDIPAPLHRPALSVVVPCFNEEASLGAFVERMSAACMEAAGGAYEIILVNDGSRDHTWARILALAAVRPGIVGLNLSRNHGQQLAATAGLMAAKGERVLLIDADLQDPPELLGAMMARMDEGFDVIYGRRRRRAKESMFKLAMANLYYRLLSRVAEVEIPRDTCDFKLMSARIVERLNQMPEQDRFVRGMVAWLGGRQSELLYDRDARYAGQSNYTFLKLLKLGTTGLTSFSTLPLSLASLLAGFSCLAGTALVLYILASFFTGRALPGWTSLALIMVFFSTAQLVCLAILGSYVGRIFMQVKSRPLFLVDEIAVSKARVGLAAPAQAIVKAVSR
jgi:polyisoprenyl-phosphate glycosyltransferase